MHRLSQLLLAAAICGALSACVPVVAGGAATTGLVASDRRTSGAYVEDEGIEWKANGLIKDALGDKIHINVTSYNRNVLLTGEASDAAAKSRAEELARGVENVRHVTNELEIAVSSAIIDRANDSYLTTKIKSLFLEKNLFPANYVKVVTENSVVYLLGIVTHKEAEDAVNIASGTDGVQKVVKVFEYIE
ncbi:osmotically-inducible protein Y precursor [mine drainage metagenome]|uniref:Osmotically-inducible protein Y n=1 Tax=mine drainage metagenome TaxID=410659 RepID=A0A1J5Q6N0_9ZZZZ